MWPQDTETHTCAESSLWSLLNYYGSGYKNYQPLLPSDELAMVLAQRVGTALPQWQESLRVFMQSPLYRKE
jgi:hypothetical protein